VLELEQKFYFIEIFAHKDLPFFCTLSSSQLFHLLGQLTFSLNLAKTLFTLNFSKIKWPTFPIHPVKVCAALPIALWAFC
jgi:hypothetical protein